MASRRLVVEIVGDSRSLEGALNRSSRASKNWGNSMQRAARGGVVATVGFRGLGRSVAFASASFLGGAGFVAGARAAVKAASDLGEEINKTNVLFGTSAGQIRRWSRTTATALGLSQRASLSAAGNFGAMFETLELGDPVAARMSKRLVGLGADLASFSNQDPSDMLDRLRSGLAGEAEPLRRFGILLSEARVKQEAYRSGLAETGATLTEQQKVLARFNLILKDSAAAQGDFARTSTSQANQERINAALREEAAKRIGQVLLPAYNQATRAINKWLGEEKNLAQIQKATTRALEIGTSVARAFADVVRTIAPILERLNRILGGTEESVKLLLAVMVGAKIVAFGTAITGLSSAALVATGRVTALRFALLRLGAIGAVAITFDLLIHKNEVDDFLERHGLGFFKGSGIDVGKRLLRRTDVGKKFLRLGGISTEEDESTEEARRRSRGGSLRGPALEAQRAAAAAKKAEENRRKAVIAAAAAKARARKLETARAAAAERRAAQEDVRRAEEAAARARKAAAVAAERAAAAQRTAALRRRRQSDQFRALGLTGEGQQRVPSAQALRRRLGSLRDQLKGTPLDTQKTRQQLARIAKVLSGQFGKVGRDVRSAILQMFADISGALQGGGGKAGPLTKTTSLNSKKLLAGIGLSPDEIRELRGRLSSFNSAGIGFAGSPRAATAGGFGGGPIVVESHTVLNIDGQKIAAIITRNQQKTRRRNPKQKRGPNRNRGD